MSVGTCPYCEAHNSYRSSVCHKCHRKLPWSDAIENAAQNVTPNDQPSSLLNVFSIIFPIIGLAAWLILMNSSPRRAREAGISAFIGAVLIPLVTFLLILIVRP